MKWRRQGEGGRMAPGGRQEDPLGVPVGLGDGAAGGGVVKHGREKRGEAVATVRGEREEEAAT